MLHLRKYPINRLLFYSGVKMGFKKDAYGQKHGGSSYIMPLSSIAAGFHIIEIKYTVMSNIGLHLCTYILLTSFVKLLKWCPI